MLEINNICRICLKEEDPKLPIFTEDEGKSKSKLTLPEKIMSFAKVQVVKDDGLPTYICVKCYCQVDMTIEFKRLCEESFHFVTQQLDIGSSRHSASKEINSIKGDDSQDSKDNSDLNTRLNTSNNHRSFSENQPEESSSLQIFSTAGNVPAWTDEGERVSDQIEVDLSIVKTEVNWDCDYDVPDPKQNGYDNYEDSGETSSNFMEETIKQEEPPPHQKKCRCHSCGKMFESRRDVAAHIIAAHRTCANCGMYFLTNKLKDSHLCYENGNKKEVEESSSKSGQFCRLCKTTVKHMKLHRTSIKHRKSKEKFQEFMKETNPLEINENNEKEMVETIKTEGGGEEKVNGIEEKKIQCKLCSLVCQTERGYKVHMIRMHRDYRIVYHCSVCNLRRFYSRSSCEKHMLDNHKEASTDNLFFEFVPIKKANPAKEDPEKAFVKKKRSIVVNKFECSYCSTKYLSFEKCLEHLFLLHKSSNAQKIKILRESSDFIESEKKTNNQSNHESSSLPPKWIPFLQGEKKEEDIPKKMRPKHPDFVLKTPIIKHNFEAILEIGGAKKYKCHGCQTIYHSYISAYNHYYNYNRKVAKVIQKQIPGEVKKFDCKICSMKFATRNLAVAHRLQAHKFSFKQIKMAKKPKVNPEVLKDR